MPASRTKSRHRGGYTLIELLVVNILFTLLVVLIAGAWRALGPISIEVIARGRIVNEANIAARVLYQDSHASPSNVALTQVVETAGTTLEFDYGTPVIGQYPYAVTYTFTPTPTGAKNSVGQVTNSVGRLERNVLQDGHVTSVVTIARNVESVVALTLPNLGTTSQVQYTVTFAYRGFRGQYTFLIHT